MPSLFKRCEICVSLMQPTPEAEYSASVVDWAVDVCILDLQWTASAKVITIPLVDS